MHVHERDRNENEMFVEKAFTIFARVIKDCFNRFNRSASVLFNTSPLAPASHGFTLAEIMIVLTVIGILTAILVPVAIESAPDENIMKFKKGNETLYKVINELVNSDKYYLDGDLGTKADGTLIDGTHDGDKKYLCNSIVDIVSTKQNNCSDIQVGKAYRSLGYSAVRFCIDPDNSANVRDGKEWLDKICKENTSTGEEIKTTDDIVYYQTSPGNTFGEIWDEHDDDGNDVSINTLKLRRFGCTIDGHACFGYDFDTLYKPFCMDVDGINYGEDPFGYGIRADGKIFMGKRAEEWSKKGITQED